MKSIISLISLILFSSYSIFPQGFDQVNIEATKLTDRIYVLTGAGGNIGVSIGDDGIFVIDAQFAPLSKKIEAKLRELSDKPIKMLVNTHYHGDHTGGNSNMHGFGAMIIAHDNVRERLANQPGRNGQLAPKEALPVMTYNDKMNIYVNGEQVALVHVDNAHTDGDTLLYFVESNVLHLGDTYFKDWYPYIDLDSGGSVNGYIAAVKKGLMIADDDTKIIFGHGGTVANKTEYASYLEMLEGLKKIILEEIKKGKTEDEVATDTSLTKTYDDQGFSWRFINSEKIRRTFYKSLKG